MTDRFDDAQAQREYEAEIESFDDPAAFQPATHDRTHCPTCNPTGWWLDEHGLPTDGYPENLGPES